VPEIGLFVVAAVLLAIAPGPDVIYVLTRGVAQGPRAGIAAALGFATGCIFHTVLAAVGVAALIRSSEVAFDLVRYAGAAYLIWIGIQALRHRASFSIEGSEDARALATIYKQSVLGNMLNPKVTLFFLAFLPQFVNQQAGNVGLQMAILGVVFMLVTLVVFGAVAIFAGWIGAWMRARPVIDKRLNVFAGITFIALGIRVALPDAK
jgi:threonine/homoserine/homoserine lactone efflux protein